MGGIQNSTTTFQTCLVIIQLSLGYLWNKNLCSHKKLFSDVYSSFICNFQKLETTSSAGEWRNFGKPLSSIYEKIWMNHCSSRSPRHLQIQWLTRLMGTWNVRSMNQGKLEVVKQEMARVNVDILGISELKWTGLEWVNLTQITIISTTVGKNPL